MTVEIPETPDFDRIEIDGNRWWVRREFAARPEFRELVATLASGDADPATLVQRRRGHYSWRHTDPASGEVFFVKEYYPRNALNAWLYRFRQNRARREVEAATRLAALGLPVPPLLAWVEQREGGMWRRGVLVFTALDNAVDLRRLDWSRTGLTAAVAPLAHDIARLHDHGVYFGDLHSGNVLWVEGRGCVFTDFDKVRFFDDLPERYWVDDLARFNAHIDAPVALRMMFLRTYCHRRKLRDVRRVHAAVNRQTEYLWRKYYRKHRLDVRKY